MMDLHLKFNYLTAIALASAMTVSANAADLLNEGFENAFPPAGWTVIDCDLPDAVNHWEASDYRPMAGNKTAHVSSPGYSCSDPVKEEILISPMLRLDGFYSLEFIWKGATAQSINKAEPEYDFQIRVREKGSDNWHLIFSFLDEEMVRNSGVAFPWTAWTNNTSSINLTEFKGKEVEFAFVYCLLKAGPGTGNDLWLDEVKIVESMQVTGPVAAVTPDVYTFPTTYIGGKRYSEAFTLKNTGKDVLTVTGVTGLDDSDFGCTLKPADVALKVGEEYRFQFWYEPTMTGAARGNAVIVTNGGEITVNLTGTKRNLPAGFSYEGFESEVFPPLGWKTTGDSWYRYGYGLSGDASAACGFTQKSELISPRLDLSEDRDWTLSFSYFDQFETENEDANGPANEFEVYFSTDGLTWQKVWKNYVWNESGSASIELGNPKSDNCYVKFSNILPNFSMSDYDDVPDYSVIFLDDVVLPPFYGSADAPGNSSAVYPADGASDVYHKNLELKWSGVQFATEYRLYLGTSASDFNIVNGENMGLATSCLIPRLDYDTKYYWKVVPVNGDKENTSAPVWNFTVMKDQSVTGLPYSQGFEEGVPLGWNIIREGYTRWDTTNTNPYDGSVSMIAIGNNNDTSTSLETPEFNLPADSDPQISFYWGNAAPVSLKKDATGQLVNTTTAHDGIDALYFDIEVDGEWKNLAILSDKEHQVWYRESFSLKEYAGKPVAFRWRYEVYNGMQSKAGALDNVKVENLTKGQCMAVFGVSEWNAGEANHNASITSRHPVLLTNQGKETLEVSAVEFGTSRFSSDLQKGTRIEPNRSAAIYLTFDAGDKEGVQNDILKVTFTDGTSAEFPVSGTTLASDVYFYDFEKEQNGSLTVDEFMLVDRDRYATVQPLLIYFPNEGAPYAYIVLNCTADYADWRDVFPRSGEQVLAAMRESTGQYDTDDWIISPRLEATSESRFRFYGKTYGSSDSQFSQNKVEVLVSTTDREPSSFKTVRALQNLPWAGENKEFNEIVTDLSEFAGQNIYVALRHVAEKTGFVSFFDDFYFEHFNGKENSVMTIESWPSAEKTELYNLNGLPVDPATALPGIYIRRCGNKTDKIVIR